MRAGERGKKCEGGEVKEEEDKDQGQEESVHRRRVGSGDLLSHPGFPSLKSTSARGGSGALQIQTS